MSPLPPTDTTAPSITGTATDDPEAIAARTAEYEDRFANPFVAASRGYIDEVIYPHSTRRRIALGLRKLRNKDLQNPWKKHDNIPL
jgi:propionyl-CoA carboxylase beta chain